MTKLELGNEVARQTSLKAGAPSARCCIARGDGSRAYFFLLFFFFFFFFLSFFFFELLLLLGAE